MMDILYASKYSSPVYIRPIWPSLLMGAYQIRRFFGNRETLILVEIEAEQNNFKVLKGENNAVHRRFVFAL